MFADMHLDWVSENERSQTKQHNTEDRRLIRRRATQAAVLTKEKQKGRPLQSGSQLQEVHTWTVNPLTNQNTSASASKAEQRVSAILLKDPRSLVRSSKCFEQRHRLLPLSTLSVPQHHTLIARVPMPDEQVRHFIVLALGDPDYLSSIGSLYGRSKCLDAAIDCLGACLQDLASVSPYFEHSRQLYGRALFLLQRAIATNSVPERYEIYYAIPLLVLFELIGPSEQLAYLRHGRGAVHLLHFIGAEGIRTELDKSLLAMQSDLMVAENLRDGQKHCCDDSAWQNALLQTIRHDLATGITRSEANITLNIIATALPSVFTEVDKAIKTPNTSDEVDLRAKIRVIMDGLKSWQIHWHPVLRTTVDRLNYFFERKVLLTTSLMYSTILCRLAVAMSSTSDYRLTWERKAAQAAHEILEILESAASCGAIGQSRLALNAKFARSVTDTSEDWQSMIDQKCPTEMKRELFRAWCVLLVRQAVPETTKIHS